MRSLALLVLLLVVSLSFKAITGHCNNGRYYTYVLTSGVYENGELVINESVVFKLIEVNETAYRVILAEYNESSMLGQWFKRSLELLINRTGGVVSANMYGGVIRGHGPAEYTLWLPPKATDMVNREKSRVCSLYEDYMNCSNSCREKYQGDTTAMRECRKECLEKYKPLLPLEDALLAPYSPSELDLTGVICGRVPQVHVKSIRSTHSSNNYVFELEAVQEPGSTITVKTIYSNNGWLIYPTSKYIKKFKNAEGKQMERICINSIKLVDTNDDGVKDAIENTAHLSNTGGLSPSFPTNTETIAVAVGVTAIIAIVVVVLKKLWV